MTNPSPPLPEAMPDKATPSPWSDQFERPTLEALLGALDSEARQACEALLEALRTHKGVKEQVEWLGLPWRWTLIVTRPRLERPAWVYLVLRPEGPVVCVPTPVGVLEGAGAAELTKSMRTRLEAGPIVAGYVWAEWRVPDADPVAIRPLLEARDGGTPA